MIQPDMRHKIPTAAIFPQSINSMQIKPSSTTQGQVLPDRQKHIVKQKNKLVFSRYNP